MTETAEGIPVGIVVAEWDAKSLSGQDVRMYQKQAIFKVEVGTLVLTLTTTTDFKDTVLLEFDQKFDELVMLDQ